MKAGVNCGPLYLISSPSLLTCTMMRICGFETGYVYAANGIPPCCQVLLNFVSFVMAAGLALYSYVKWGYGIRATPSDIFSQGIKAIIR
jgi:hypothetical protein